jgi:succinyl-CoA synthetase beta subunit
LQDCDSIAQQLNLTEMLTEQFNQTLLSLYEIFTTKDASLIEINPLIVTVENTLLALDGKIDFDDNALYRHEDIIEVFHWQLFQYPCHLQVMPKL